MCFIHESKEEVRIIGAIDLREKVGMGMGTRIYSPLWATAHPSPYPEERQVSKKLSDCTSRVEIGQAITLWVSEKPASRKLVE